MSTTHAILAKHAIDIQVDNLPDLPSIIRYVDPYKDAYAVIRDPATSDEWSLDVNGSSVVLRFSLLPQELRLLAKHAICWSLSKYSPNTVLGQFDGLCWASIEIGPTILTNAFVVDPFELKSLWLAEVLPKLIEARQRSTPLKMYYRFLCERALGCLHPGHETFVSSWPGPKQDLYASIRNADNFLKNVEEAQIVTHLDEFCRSATTDRISILELRQNCMLICAYQHAMRPIQIAKVRQQDVVMRLNKEATFDGPIIHVRFHREKQSSASEKLAMVRKIKREWAFIFKRYAEMREQDPRLVMEDGAVDDSFFGLPPDRVSSLIKDILHNILDFSRSATDLRHSAAQRMADAGASHDEIQELLGHNNKRTALRYFAASPTQAERLNKALSVSPIYSEIAKIYSSRTIDMDRLMGLPADKQIGAVAHGVPISGIGGCQLGQSLCTKNPVLSCYGCRKFLPVHDVTIHQYVQDTLRPVVRQFFDASHGEVEAPAYTQLKHTLAAVQQTIVELGGVDESEP